MWQAEGNRTILAYPSSFHERERHECRVRIRSTSGSKRHY